MLLHAPSSVSQPHISVQCRLFALHVQVLREHALRSYENMYIRQVQQQLQVQPACVTRQVSIDHPLQTTQVDMDQGLI